MLIADREPILDRVTGSAGVRRLNICPSAGLYVCSILEAYCAGKAVADAQGKQLEAPPTLSPVCVLSHASRFDPHYKAACVSLYMTPSRHWLSRLMFRTPHDVSARSFSLSVLLMSFPLLLCLPSLFLVLSIFLFLSFFSPLLSPPFFLPRFPFFRLALERRRIGSPRCRG